MSKTYEHPAASILTGLSRFDGISIVADPITDARHDRVLPIMEEEQIFMCRQMDAVIRRAGPGALALDVGTGSGVFAIWAARRGCRVLAVDVSMRAIAVTRRNASQNHINTRDSLDQLQPGEIC